MEKRSWIPAMNLLLGGLFAICVQGCAQTGFSKLVWQDEFDKPGKPDPSRWGYDTAHGCPNNCGWGNNELQYYTTRTDNSIVEGGVLKVKAQRENYNGASFTSARLLSKGKFAFTYGKVEIRAKIPQGVGTWPAVWMLGNNVEKVGWPKCGEIDIVEHRGYELNKIFGTFHYPGRSGDKADGKTLVIQNATSDFHIYSTEWTKEAINIFVDGKMIHSLKNGAGVPFNHEFFLLINMAIGGGFAGPVDPAFNAATLEVDYIRVYQ